MSAVLAIRLDDDLERLLEKTCDRAGRTKSDLVRDALRRQLALMSFEDLRRDTVPHATKAGFVTDEDVFEAVS